MSRAGSAPDKSSVFHDRNVIVTGGAGFLGANLCHRLASVGAHVVAIDNFLEGGGGNEANLADAPVEIVRGDLRALDLGALCEEADYIFNLAAYTGHAGAEREPEVDLDINAAAQLRLIRAVRESAPKAVVVHASTRQVYGRPTMLPVNESHPLVPPDSNAVSKLAGEQYWMLEHRSKDRSVVSLRLTNCYGPRLRIADGQQGFIGHWLRAALTGSEFQVWGGTQLRDLAYVDDVTQAMLMAAADPRCFGSIFNVGGSPPVRLDKLAKMLVQAAEGRTSSIIMPFPSGQASIDIGSYHTDDTAFRRTSGWAPTVELAEGLRRTLDWYRPRLGSYLPEDPASTDTQMAAGL